LSYLHNDSPLADEHAEYGVFADMQMMTIREIARHSGWPEGRIRRLVAARRLRHVKLDGLLLLPANAVDEFVQANMVEPDLKFGSQPSPTSKGALL
jgi:excisionase family DNA binding protein